MSETNYQQLYESEKKKNAFLQEKLDSLDLPGKAKLYYALNRNMSDLADMLDKVDLKGIDIEDPKNKGMERLKIIWASVSPLVETVRVLGESSGITGDEKKDTAKKGSFLDKVIS